MYILTGGAGFIGSCFLSRLNAEGIDDVLVVDNLGSTEKWKNLRGKRFLDYLHKGELLARLESDTMPQGVKAVIHLGACSSTTEMNAEYMLDNNYRYSRVLAEWALANSVRMVYASSAATYGDGNLGFSDADEDTAALLPLNVYGFSKHLFDLWALRSGASKRLAGLKFFNVYGPNEYHKGEQMSVACKAFHQINKNGKLELFKSYRSDFGDGEQKRDFLYVKDCSDVMWWLLQKPDANGVFNLGTGQARSWKDLASAAFAAMGKKPVIEFIEMPAVLRGRYQYFTQSSMEKLRNAGYTKPFTSLEQGISDYLKNYLSAENPHL